MKSDGVEDVFKWLKDKCKEQKKVVEWAEENLAKTKREWSCFDDTQCIIDSAERELVREQERLRTLVDIKISTEKYMKKLRHQGE